MEVVRIVKFRRKGWVGALVGLSSALALAQSNAPDSLEAAPVLDRVVAVVEGRPITASVLEFETRVALVQRGGVAAATASLDPRTLESGLELAITQRLQALEADKLQAFQIEPEALEEAFLSFQARFASTAEFAAFLRRNEVEEAHVLAVLERALRAERVLDSRVRLKAQVTEAEIRRYYDENRAVLADDYSEVRAAIREKLTRERYARLAAEELAAIQKASRVRRLAPPAEVTK